MASASSRPRWIWCRGRWSCAVWVPPDAPVGGGRRTAGKINLGLHRLLEALAELGLVQPPVAVVLGQ